MVGINTGNVQYDLTMCKEYSLHTEWLNYWLYIAQLFLHTDLVFVDDVIRLCWPYVNSGKLFWVDRYVPFSGINVIKAHSTVRHLKTENNFLRALKMSEFDAICPKSDGACIFFWQSTSC